MPKQLLPHDVTAAERRDCVWASRFRRRSDEIDKGATITGTPSVNWGVTLNGTTDQIAYPLNGQLLGITQFSFNYIFYPSTPYNDDIDRYLFGAYFLGNQWFGLRKRNAASNYVLRLMIAGTSIEEIAAAVYGPLWNQYGRNVITCSSISANTNMWMNGTQILTADATGWFAASNPTTLSIPGGFTFSGRIESLKFYSSLLTANDHARIWEGGGA